MVGAEPQKKLLDVGKFFRRQRTSCTKAVVHQKAVTLHDRNSIIGKVVQFIFPLAVRKFNAVEPVAADQVRNARHVNVLVNRSFAAAIQFELFEMT